MHFSAGDLVLDCICNVKYGAIFTIARPFLDRRNAFSDFFFALVVSKMKLKNFWLEVFRVE